ncbi:MmcQ/YjbR family DNA-binding protein [Dokdonia sp.]|uniref:MmcQ/YjbR family DNA-binding protein n=1 Tax=Dokdonia sp. TaxID=2024995 RepID=UPI0032645F44
MHIEEFRNYCIAKKGVTEEFPFDEKTLVFKVMGKMFALSGLERIPAQVNLKCDPERSATLREEYDGTITGAFHMSKLHWNSVILQEVPPQLITELIDHSYDLVVSKMTKKLRTELENL